MIEKDSTEKVRDSQKKGRGKCTIVVCRTVPKYRKKLAETYSQVPAVPGCPSGLYQALSMT
jgi:hypothetical protein